MLYLRRILINILNNAVKYTPEGGKITLQVRETEVRDGQVQLTISVEDNGIGMEKEFLERIFEPFTQEQSGSRGDYSGTGLGMAISKRLAEQLGGTLLAESTPGVGSKFTLCVPLGISEEAETKPVIRSMQSLNDVRILLAEDNALNRDIATELLEKAGAQVTAVEDGEAVVKAYESAEGRFDVILMDVMMPKMDGMEATRQIRMYEGHDPSGGIPIIAMTANVFEEDVKACLDAGMNAHVGKPIDMRALMDTIQRFIR